VRNMCRRHFVEPCVVKPNRYWLIEIRRPAEGPSPSVEPSASRLAIGAAGRSLPVRRAGVPATVRGGGGVPVFDRAHPSCSTGRGPGTESEGEERRLACPPKEFTLGKPRRAL
jgi:hypothetical protein